MDKSHKEVDYHPFEVLFSKCLSVVQDLIRIIHAHEKEWYLTRERITEVSSILSLQNTQLELWRNESYHDFTLTQPWDTSQGRLLDTAFKGNEFLKSVSGDCLINIGSKIITIVISLRCLLNGIPEKSSEDGLQLLSVIAEDLELSIMEFQVLGLDEIDQNVDNSEHNTRVPLPLDPNVERKAQNEPEKEPGMDEDAEDDNWDSNDEETESIENVSLLESATRLGEAIQDLYRILPAMKLAMQDARHLEQLESETSIHESFTKLSVGKSPESEIPPPNQTLSSTITSMALLVGAAATAGTLFASGASPALGAGLRFPKPPPTMSEETSSGKKTWMIPRSRFTDVVADFNSAKLKCPVSNCVKEYKLQAEYKRHIGSVHLHPWRCLHCDRDLGRKEDVIVHIKNQEKVEGEPVEGRDYDVVPQLELEERCMKLFESSDAQETKDPTSKRKSSKNQ